MVIIIYPVYTEEAENERMHLLTALVLKKPGPVFKMMVIVSQGLIVHLQCVYVLLLL